MQRLLMFVLVNLICYSSLAQADTTKISLATADWEPYISETKAGHGRFAEIVSAVFKDMDMEVDYVFAPWKRVETLVKNGEVFAGIPYSYTQERHQVFDYSVPVMNSPNVFFYNKKVYPHGISYAKLEDLARYKISGVTGYWYESLFAKAKLNVEYVTSDEQGITKLYFNRVDLAATDELVGRALINKLYPQAATQFGVVAKPFSITQLHLLVSRKYPDAVKITQKFNQTFETLRKKGALPQ